MASIVERQEEKQILDRGSWLEGRGFRYLKCSSILDVRTHSRNDVEEDDDNDDDGGWWTMVSATRSYRAWEHLWSSRYASSSWILPMLINFISPIIFARLPVDQ